MSALTAGEAALVHLSAALATRDQAGVDGALRRALADADGEAVEEALLQSYLFLGYPAALNAFARWRALSGRPASAETDPPGSWAERGEAVCREVYAGQYEGLRANVGALHADMERWMVVEGYGKVLGRPGLPLDTRELCIVALLAVQDVPRQLYSHLRGSLNVGASTARVEQTLAEALPLCSDGARARALETWAAVQGRAGGKD
ncbi:MAG TPA: carboxymuconolactone decarboxylase family protein [Longimicrobiales bacterium]|nr:carboxymuconolactone decarboxylase family protein [Longimicrobiales bacterium]